jgi:hypothetical protein
MTTKTNKFWVGILIVSFLFLFSCGEKEDPNKINLIKMQGSKARVLTFEIPNSYSRNRDSSAVRIILVTAYPGMVGKTKENIHRFEKGGEMQRGDDVVRIILSPVVSNKGSLITQNELGRKGMEELILKRPMYEKVSVTKNIEESGKIDKYWGPPNTGHLGTYGHL